MAELIIIRGNSGSGKSTLAKEIHRPFRGRALLIPQDTVRREMLGARAFQDFLAAHPDWTHIALETPLEKKESIRFYTEKCQMRLTGINREGNIPLAILERNR